MAVLKVVGTYDACVLLEANGEILKGEPRF